MTTLTNEIIESAERLLHASGAKPRDVAAILTQLAAENGCEFSVTSGLLTITQTGSLLNPGTVLGAHRAKNPRMYYGEAGEVRYKDDLAGDTAAKSRFIAEHGFDKWNTLPLNEKSPGAKHLVTDSVPSAMMRRADYMRLTTAEKTKLAGEIGATGIERILGRK